VPAGALIDTATLRPTAAGIQRPEHVARRADGRLFASDQGSAIAELRADGSIRPTGMLGGEPNGFSFTPAGLALVADFSQHAVYSVDPSSGQTALFAGQAAGQPLSHANCTLTAPDGTVWITCSTRSATVAEALRSRAADGFIARVDPSGRASIAADSVRFPNCLTFGPDQRSLLVVRTGECDVWRYEIRADGSLDGGSRYGPRLGASGPAYASPGAGSPWVPGSEWDLADGVAVDAEGGVWVTLAGANRIVRIAPSGEVAVALSADGADLLAAPTSVAWGGEDLRDIYIGSLRSTFVLTGRSEVAGTLCGNC
jgi:sugar lactone lactonase YvrE